MNSVDSNYLISVAAETLEICRDGVYNPPSGQSVNISASINNAKKLTATIFPRERIGSVIKITPNKFKTHFFVKNQSTLSAAKDYSKESVCALNFASPKKPGGRFLLGSPAQEEFICRCSALYPCIAESSMYERFSSCCDGEYSDCAIYSPDVPVFRDDNYKLLEEPFFCSFVTCAAPNYKEDLFAGSDHTEAMKNRIHRVLSIMASRINDYIVLGAWGCGSFGHNPDTVAALFYEALTTSYKGVFDTVIFAVRDFSISKNCFQSFEKTFKPLT